MSTTFVPGIMPSLHWQCILLFSKLPSELKSPPLQKMKQRLKGVKIICQGGPQGAPDTGPLPHKRLPGWEAPRGDGPQAEHPVLPLFYLEPHILPQQHPRVGHWRAFLESPRPSHPQPPVVWTRAEGELRGGAGASLEGTRRASWRRRREDLGMRGFPDVCRGEGCPRQRTKEDPRTEDPWGQGCKD